MIPILSIVGKSNSGKTTLIERLIPALKDRGYRVATIKHNRHGFDIDHEGKDSWRHRHAGAAATVIASPRVVALMEDAEKEYDISELVDRYLHNADIILVEGFKQNPFPKIEVSLAATKHGPLCTKEEGLLAVAGDRQQDRDVPWYDINDIAGLVQMIEDRVMAQPR
jgi:molybdopterin-guanine dinucleotide biosynthesis protein B